jgi:hypothetical protein
MQFINDGELNRVVKVQGDEFNAPINIEVIILVT